MLHFMSDYMDGCHPKVLERLCQTNAELLPGYGADPHSLRACDLVRQACGLGGEADVFLLAGGTQTNVIAIDALLAPWEGVVAASSGHVSLHEAGAVEFTGRKVLELPQRDGKLGAGQLAAFLEARFGDENREHMVYPGLVYLSWPTEWGTLYAKEELLALREVCTRFGLRLYVDGARLACGLACGDIALPELARLCDAFSLGGTKQGCLFGEALVFPQGAPAHFANHIKRHAGLLAKGRAAGVQFEALLEEDGAGDCLYWRIGRHAATMAGLLRERLAALGVAFAVDSPTNQLFPVFEDAALERLSGRVSWSFWEKPDASHTVVRLATSWATRQEDVEALASLVGEVLGQGPAARQGGRP
ncbi:MAG: low specificity L-threonine aldolase [Desulfovibrio sp.]|nr:low specificity L-threonine aldolase [Desulfovibrio sp.]